MLIKRFLQALGVSVLLLAAPLHAAPEKAPAKLETATPGQLRIAVYNDFPPYSYDGKGIDVDLGEALAKKLGLKPNFAWFNAGEEMNDDLRNMVWKGHYLGTKPADVMLHVPVDPHLAEENDKVVIFGGYHAESVAIARNPRLVPPLSGSAAVALEVFTREKVGVERGSLADSFLLGALNGRLRENVQHYQNVAQAVDAMKKGESAAVMAPRAELEAALGKNTTKDFVISPVKMPELRITSWALGMAVKAGNPDLAAALGKALAALQKDGTVARIFARYNVTLQSTAN